MGELAHAASVPIGSGASPLELGAFGRRLSGCFRLGEAPTLITATLKAATLAVTRLASGDGTAARTLPIPAERAYLVMLQLRDVPKARLWLGERVAFEGALPQGSIGIVHLDDRPSFHLPAAFDMLLFYVPQLAFDELSANGTPGIGELACPWAVADPIVRELGRALLPALEAARQPGDLFFDHVVRALHAHLARRYGRAAPASQSVRGCLAAWQERIAREMLRADLSLEPSIARVAHACGMPMNRFARAFRKTTGLPPHRWLRGMRVERAKELLFDSDLSLSEIAYECGFADQSHLTRVFAGAIGMTPGAWRRARRGADIQPPPALLAHPARGTVVTASARAA